MTSALFTISSLILVIMMTVIRDLFNEWHNYYDNEFKTFSYFPKDLLKEIISSITIIKN